MLTYADVCRRMLTYADGFAQESVHRETWIMKEKKEANLISTTSLMFQAASRVYTYIYVYIIIYIKFTFFMFRVASQVLSLLALLIFDWY
jgi:hypothetical protein